MRILVAPAQQVREKLTSLRLDPYLERYLWPKLCQHGGKEFDDAREACLLFGITLAEFITEQELPEGIATTLMATFDDLIAALVPDTD